MLRELEDRPDGMEHRNVAVSHEPKSCISVSLGGYVVFEHFEK